MRVDKWLWSVRLAPSRTAATEACASGRVTIDGEIAKPARRVKVGEIVELRRDRRTVTVEVLELIEKRVGAPIAVTCYADLTPPHDPDGDPFLPPPPGYRPRGQGRPTKRDRRAIDRLRGGPHPD